MKIRVERKHIEAAEVLRDNSERELHCPIALALAEAGFDTPRVSELGAITFGDGSEEKQLDGDERIRKQVNNFDSGRDCRSFVLTIDENRLWTRPVKP